MERDTKGRPSLRLDTTTPVLSITSPVPGTTTLDQPVLQLQGFADKDLCSLSYDLSNAAGLVTNLDVLVLNRSFDTSQWRVRTNTFQAFDIGLTPGNNTITLHAMDWAGNWTSASLVYALDYSGKTNAPGLQLYWPTNGALITGSNFVWRGWVDDPTVSVSAQIVDTNGDTNVVNGIVERNGNFWVENLPLASGSNWLTLTVADAHSNATNISIGVLQSSVGLSFLCIPDITNQTTVDVEGTISDTSYTVWVNGVQAATNYEGASNYGCASNVPVNAGGTALMEALAIPNSDNGGCGIPNTGGNGTNSTLQNPGNPTPSEPCPVLQVEQDKSPAIVYSEIHVASFATNVTSDGHTLYNSLTADWTLGSGGNCLWITWDSEQLDFGWTYWAINASTTCTGSNGYSSVFGDYTQLDQELGGLISDPDDPYGWLTENLATLGYVPVGGWNYPGVAGGMADYDTATTVTNVQNNSSYYGAVTDRCVALQAYMPNGKAVPVQNIVAFNVEAAGAPSSKAHP